jgi:predicted transcriptional regulator
MMLGNGKRSDMEVAAAILHVALNGAKKSHIIYQANLNFQLGKKYLDRLITAGLLNESNNGRRVYSTTEKGVDYLNYLDGFKQFLPHPHDGSEAS